MKDKKDISTSIGHVVGTCIGICAAACIIAIAGACTIKFIAWILF